MSNKRGVIIMKKEYLSPKFEVLKVYFEKDILAGPSQNVNEETNATQATDVTEWDPFM